MKWTTEAKVGAFSLAGLIVFAIIIIQLTDVVLFGKSGFHVTGQFPQAEGVSEGSPVHYAGVDVGQVDGIYIANGHAEILMRFYDGNQIPVDAQFSIQNGSVMGGRYIMASGGHLEKGYLQDGMTVKGSVSPGFDEAMKKVDVLLDSAQQMVDSINKVTSDPASQKHVRNTLDNVDDMTRNMAILTSQGIQIADQVQSIAEQVNGMLMRLDGDGKVTSDARQIMDNLNVISSNARDMSYDVKKISGKLGNAASGMYLSGNGELLYNTNDKTFSPNVSFRIGGDDFGLLGAESIGDHTLWNVQFGHRQDEWSFRGGVIRGQAGAGADYETGKWKLGADLYDPNDLTFRFRGSYELYPNIYAIGQTIQPHKREGGGEYIGVGYTY